MPLGSILPTLDATGPHFGSVGLSGVALDFILEALDLILEALGDILGMAWVPDWPGDPRMGWIALTLERDAVLLGSRDPGNGPSGGWICRFWALLSTNN